jgi:hypothetical protein
MPDRFALIHYRQVILHRSTPEFAAQILATAQIEKPFREIQIAPLSRDAIKRTKRQLNLFVSRRIFQLRFAKPECALDEIGAADGDI